MQIEYEKGELPEQGSKQMLKGINHFNHNGYINALKCFEKSAKGDNECALLLSASIYYMGFNGVTRNTRKAFDYFKKVAIKWKNPIGQYYVGVMLLTGETGSEQKKEEAIEWLTLAAEGGWNSAQAAVGLVYYGGLGVEKDYKKATTWFNKAVQADNKLNGCDNETYESEDLVVYLFNNKRFRLKVDLKAKQLLDEYDVFPDVEDGDVSGFNLYQEASTDTQDKSRIEAMFWYSMTGAPYLKGVCQLTQGKICWLGEDEDPKKAIFWFTEAKESCRRHGCYLIGLMHFSDDQDYYVAMQCFEKAANAGHPNALAMLAVIFRDGVLVDKNFKKALNYAERSLEKNQSAGMYLIMGCIYDSGGYGIKQDCKRAFNLYMKAAEKKDGLAACILGVYYMVGHKHIRRDDRKAFEWFQKSAKYGYGDGQFLLSLYYLRGTFVRRDVEYAKRLQREALMNGSEIAAEHILGVDLLNMFMAMQFLSLE